MTINLLERESPLLELNATLKEAIAGEGRVALVSGEAGIGKTSLVAQFTRERQDSVRVLWGACDALITPHPLGPLYDIATQTQGELLALLTSDSNRQAIFSACLSELQRRPAVVVFEDVHWADEATLDLIKFLGRRIQRTPSLLILTYRDDELGGQHPLRLVFGDLLPSATLRLSLLPLSQASVSVLARAAAQSERIGDLYATTGGNPFYVTEVLASGGARVPATVRDAVLARAARLSPEAREMLNAASAVPGHIETRLLEAILSPMPVAVEECMERGMLRSDGNALVFRHELARRAIEDALSPSKRQAIHQRVLKELIEWGEDRVQLSRLVHHAKFAGDAEAVLCFAPQAGKQAAIVGAHLEAAAHYKSALRYSDRIGQVEHAQLLENLAYEFYVTSQISEAIQARTEALEIWRRIQRPVQEGDNLRWLSRLLWFLGQQAQAIQYANEAIHLLENLPPSSELAMAYSNRAQLHMLANEVAEALRWGNLAIELAEKKGDIETLSHALNNVGAAELLVDQVEAGQAKLERSLQLARAQELQEHVARAYTNLGSEFIRRRDYVCGVRYLNEGIAYSLEHDLDSWSLYLLGWRSRANLEQGRWMEADQDALGVLNNPRAASVARIPALATLGHVRVRRGDPGIQPVLDEALERALPTGELQRIGPVASARAEAAWWRGEPKQVIAEAQTAFELAIKYKDARTWGELAFWIWRAGGSVELPSGEAEPFALHIAGDWRTAAEEWERLSCPYEQALALADGNEAAQLSALEIFQGLGALPAMDNLRHKLQAVPTRRLEKGKFGGLTAREREVAALISQGKSNREIAQAMMVAVKTAETYVTRILNKLGFDSRVQIATWAIEKGLGPPTQAPDY